MLRVLSMLNDPPRILIVDDEADLRQALAGLLRDEGYSVATACDGERALAMVVTTPPDVILLDMQMPVMDGPAFATAYHRLAGPHAPIVVCSTLPNDAVGPLLAAAPYLRKPFDIDRLLVVLATLLAERAIGSAD